MERWEFINGEMEIYEWRDGYIINEEMGIYEWRGGNH